jgi:hypothetical protein
MAIESEQQLIELLRDVRGLDPEDIAVMIATANYSSNGHLRGLYLGSMMRKCARHEIINFFQKANARLVGYGGHPDGDRVYRNYYPTSDNAKPCVERDDASCWVPASNSWEPRN